MNILNIISTNMWGGIEQYVYDICKEGKKRGNTMFVAINSNQIAIIKRYEYVATVFPVDFRKRSVFQTLFVLKKLIKEKNIKFINIHNGKVVLLLGTMIKKELGQQVKLIVFRHNIAVNKKDLYHRYLQKVADVFICVSKVVYNLQLESIEKKYKDKIKLIYNGIDAKRFPKINILKNTNEYVIGFAGRIVEDKGLLVLVEAFEILLKTYPKFKLRLAGESEIEFAEKFQRIIKEKQIENSVEFIGYTEEMNEFYRSLDLFVLPSIVKESFGLVLCEAMVCEVPVITTNSGAQEEIVKDGFNGSVINPSQVEELKAAIEKMYIDDEFSKKIVKNAKMCVENKFTMKSCVDGVEDVYKELK